MFASTHANEFVRFIQSLVETCAIRILATRADRMINCHSLPSNEPQEPSPSYIYYSLPARNQHFVRLWANNRRRYINANINRFIKREHSVFIARATSAIDPTIFSLPGSRAMIKMLYLTAIGYTIYIVSLYSDRAQNSCLPACGQSAPQKNKNKYQVLANSCHLNAPVRQAPSTHIKVRLCHILPSPRGL